MADTPQEIGIDPKTLALSIMGPIKEQLDATLKEFREEEAKTVAERDVARMQVLDNKFADQAKAYEELAEKVKSQYSLPGAEPVGDPKKDLSIARACYGVKTGDWAKVPVENEIRLAMQAKAMDTTSDPLGGFIVPEENVRPIIDILRSMTVVRDLGATVLSVAGSPVQIPRLSASATAAWVGENTAITPSDPTFEQVTATPHKAAALVAMSNEMLLMGTPGADTIINQDIAAQIARLEDLAALSGTGAANSPVGILNTSGVNTTALDVAGSNNYTAYAAFIAELRTDDALFGSLGWAMDPTCYNDLLTMPTADSTGDHFPLARVIIDQIGGGIPAERVLGYPVKTTSQMTTCGTAGSCTFGNWADLLICEWGGITLTASNQAGTAFAADQTWIRATKLTDFIVRHPVSFCINS